MAAPGLLPIPPGALAAMPFALLPGTGRLFALAQACFAQDFSLRAWVSRVPGGAFLPTDASFWPLAREVAGLLLAFDAAGAPPAASGPSPLLGKVALLPGAYTLNVLNLAGSENAVSWSWTDVSCLPVIGNPGP